MRTEEVKTSKAENASKPPTAIPLNVLFLRHNAVFSYEGSFLLVKVSVTGR